MSNDALLGLVLGVVAGAVLVESCKPARDLVGSVADEVKAKITTAKKASKSE